MTVVPDFYKGEASDEGFSRSVIMAEAVKHMTAAWDELIYVAGLLVSSGNVTLDCAETCRLNILTSLTFGE